MSQTLKERLWHWRDYQARKHEKGEDYAENEINKLTQWEFLCEISDAISEMLEEMEPRK